VSRQAHPPNPSARQARKHQSYWEASQACLGAGRAHKASCRALRVYTRLANKLRAWYLWAVAKGELENGNAEAAPLSETTAAAARTAAAATGSLKTAAAGPAVAKPNRSRAPRRSHQHFAQSRTA
jgi:hypothetical protein